MSLFEWVTVIIGGVTAIVGIGSLIFVGMQLRQNAIEARDATLAAEVERRRQRKRETMEAIAASARYRQELKAGLPWNDRDAEVVREFLDKAETDDATKGSVRAYLDYLEMLAAGVNEDVLDAELLARISGARIIAVANNYSIYIDRRRKELGSPSLYSELKRLADTMVRIKQYH